MSTKISDGVRSMLAPFHGAIALDFKPAEPKDNVQPDKLDKGQSARYDLVVQQTASLLGEVKWNETEGRVKVSAKGIVTQGTKIKGAIPMNNPAAILYRFAAALNEATAGGDFEVIATVPVKCTDWLKNLKVTKPETAEKLAASREEEAKTAKA